jgi:hypothetical protein
MLAMRRTGRARLLVRAAAAAALAVVAGIAAGGCAGPGATAASGGAATATPGGASGAAASPPAASASPTAASATAPSPWPVVVAVPGVKAGQHQTSTRPPAQSAVFRAEMTDLWAAVASGRPDLAMSAFFPVVAYEQVKAIPDPAADWRSRLVTEFKADVMAAHDLLGHRARHAELVRVIVPEQEANWIYPGVCDNAVGYWHVAGARLVYRVGGQEKSFGIATLISWRGRWYVVHLGGELRTAGGGMIDQPSSGPGAPGPPGGC